MLKLVVINKVATNQSVTINESSRPNVTYVTFPKTYQNYYNPLKVALQHWLDSF